MNHAYEAANFHAEFDLQNAADSGIYEAAEKIRVTQEINGERLPWDKRQKLFSRTKQIHGQNIQVTVWGKRLNVQSHRRNYPTGKTKQGSPKYGYTLLSIAELTDDTGSKKYRRAFAYVIDGHGESTEQTVAPDKKDVIHFMELPSGETK